MPGARSSGHLVYAREATLFAARFDEDRLEMQSQPAPVLEGIASSGASTGNGGTQLAFSTNGTLAYLPGQSHGVVMRMARADRTGTATPLAAEPGLYFEPRLSPDGRRVAFQVVTTVTSDIWVHDLERATTSRLTFEGDFNGQPVWTPDGQRIAFVSDREDSVRNIYWTRSDGAGQAERLTTSKSLQYTGSFSPGGKLLAFDQVNPDAGSNEDIWILPLEGERKPTPFLTTPAVEVSPSFSPDGRWIAYMSNESGRMEIYVRPYPGPGGKWQVSTSGGILPHWTKGGRELIYTEDPARNRFLAVPVSPQGDTFQAGKPELLFEGNFQWLGDNPHFDVSRDGKQFIVFQGEGPAADQTDLSHLTFIFNWFDQVRRLAPTGKD